MTQFDRYVLRKYLTTIGFVFLIFIAIILVFLMVDDLDTFLENENVTWSEITRYVIYSVPHLVVRFLPLVTLLALVFTMHQLMKWGEVKAIMASGASHRRISLAFIIVGLGMVLLQFLVNEMVAADCEAIANKIMVLEIKGKTPGMASPSGYFVRGPNNRFYHAREFNLRENRLLDVKVFRLNSQDSALMEIVQADQAVYDKNGEWILQRNNELDEPKDVEIMLIHDARRRVDRKHREKMNFGITPETFLDLSLDPRRMSYFGLSKYLQVLKSSNEDTSRYQSELQLKLAFPFSCMIFTLIALTVAFRLRGTNLTFEIGLAVLLGFVYYMFTAIMVGLGNKELLDPWLAAWIPTLLFGSISLTTFIFSRTD
jgi:lipopolysaccharide export system permease protein